MYFIKSVGCLVTIFTFDMYTLRESKNNVSLKSSKTNLVVLIVPVRSSKRKAEIFRLPSCNNLIHI